MSTGEIMDRKCSAGSFHRAMGIVEEAIVLLFLYFSTSAPFSRRAVPILLFTSFLRSISSIPYPASLYVTKCSICLDCIAQAKEEKRELKKRRINEMVREGRAFVPELSGMFKYYCEPCTTVKE